MKPEQRENDEPVRKLLGEWSVNSPLPPRFQESVWRRIERRQTEAPPAGALWRAAREAVGRLFSRPAMAVSYLLLLLAIGATAGWTQAREERARVRGELSGRYVRSIDPYSATP